MSEKTSSKVDGVICDNSIKVFLRIRPLFFDTEMVKLRICDEGGNPTYIILALLNYLAFCKVNENLRKLIKIE